MNKIESWIKQHKGLTILIIIIGVPFIVIYKPYKATNPSNPLFFPQYFRISDYDFRPWGLKDALKKLFPVGTSMKQVDLMLVERGGATKAEPFPKDKDQWYGYGFQPFYMLPTGDGWAIDVKYDKSQKVKAIKFKNQVLVGEYNPKTGE